MRFLPLLLVLPGCLEFAEPTCSDNDGCRPTETCNVATGLCEAKAAEPDVAQSADVASDALASDGAPHDEDADGPAPDLATVDGAADGSSPTPDGALADGPAPDLPLADGGADASPDGPPPDLPIAPCQQMPLPCEARPGDVEPTEWDCEDTEGGPLCTARVCPGEAVKVDGRCRVEICNNGVDDDGDGLVDGVVGDRPDPCTATFDQREAQGEGGLRMGSCDRSIRDDDPDCDDADAVDPDGWGSRHFTDDQPKRAVRLEYAYALDKEEVSIRAYARCVAAGACSAARGRDWLLADTEADPDALPPRREAHGCPDGEPELVDLPVTGVTWCQARNYCAWAGKRLATEYEWERAAMGVGRPRTRYTWGDEGPPDCSDEQCCRSADYEGAAPALCGGGVPVCGGGPHPNGAGPACFAHYVPEPGEGVVCSPWTGPRAVNANVDGASPEGLLNMNGNVTEWVFDWYRGNYDWISSVNPIGAACSNEGGAAVKTVRGVVDDEPHRQLASIYRGYIYPALGTSRIGFRCARTVPDDGSLCAPGVPDAPEPEGRLPCAAPDFVNAHPDDLLRCPGPGRVAEGRCDVGLRSLCPAGIISEDRGRSDCANIYLLESLRLSDVVELSGAGAFLDGIFAASLAPQGGPSIMALEGLREFHRPNTAYRVRVGNAILLGGNLEWAGGDPDNCEPLGSWVGTMAAAANPEPICRVTGRGEVALNFAPVSLIASQAAITLEPIPQERRLRGTIILAISLRDMADSIFGGEPALGTFRNLDLPDIDFCSRLALGRPAGCDDWGYEDCDGERCTNPELCTGITIPLTFTAIPAADANIPGLLCPQ